MTGLRLTMSEDEAYELVMGSPRELGDVDSLARLLEPGTAHWT